MGQGKTKGGAEEVKGAGLTSITEVTGLISVVLGLGSDIKGAAEDIKGADDAVFKGAADTLDTRVEDSLSGLCMTLTGGVLGLGFISRGRDLGLVWRSGVREILLGWREGLAVKPLGEIVVLDLSFFDGIGT